MILLVLALNNEGDVPAVQLCYELYFFVTSFCLITLYAHLYVVAEQVLDTSLQQHVGTTHSYSFNNYSGLSQNFTRSTNFTLYIYPRFCPGWSNVRCSSFYPSSSLTDEIYGHVTHILNGIDLIRTNQLRKSAKGHKPLYEYDISDILTVKCECKIPMRAIRMQTM